MTKPYLFALVLTLLGASLSACGGSSAPDPNVGTTIAIATSVSESTLTTRHWRLVEAQTADGTRIGDLFPDPDRAIQIDFADGRLSVSHACNRMGGDYTLTGDRLEVGDVMQTEMACDEVRMRAEAAIGRVVRGGGTLRLEGSDVLVWTTPTNDTLRFHGEQTADARYGGAGERVFFEVAAQRVPCGEASPDTCLRVREVRYDDGGLVVDRGAWEILAQPIEGFTHEPGTRTVLRLTRYTNAAASAPDATSIAYVLDMVVESEIVAP